MCGMLGAAHYEYQWSIREHEETGKNIVAVRLKAWDLKNKKQKTDENILAGSQSTLTGLLGSALF